MSQENFASIFADPSDQELAILKRLLSVEFQGRSALSEQLEHITVRRIDCDGSLELRPRKTAPKAAVMSRIPVEAELLDLDGIGIHILLHVVNGLMNELEIYREDSEPVQRRLDSDQLALIVL